MTDARIDGRGGGWLRSTLVGVITGAIVFAAFSVGGLAQPAPATAADSLAVTVRADAYDNNAAASPFPDLELTVSQTRGLVSQGIEISWTGGKESTQPTQQTGGENFLQFAQCWGDDPANPSRPDRTTCQYGAFLTPGATRDANRSADSVAEEDAAYSTPADGFFTPAHTSIPFRTTKGEVVASVVDGKRVDPPVDVNTNPFFTQYTSNEIPWAGSAADGTGRTKFEVQTSVQAPALGCGAAVEGSETPRSCWLVAIPRGTADVGETSITKSGLFWGAWKHHVAIRLDFRPVGNTCAIGGAERQLAGSELVATAVASWQPSICGSAGGSAFTLMVGAESDALMTANGTSEAPPLALSSRPLAGDAGDNLVYAPVALTGVAISFAIDRFPKVDGSVPPEVVERARLPFESMNLTPRLVAKLITASYRDALPLAADRTHLDGNPRNLLFDPEFLAINDPEWAQQAIASVSIADMTVPQGRSDAAYAVWSYVVADPDARAFLAGEPDGFGMVVNPWSLSDPETNPTGTGAHYPLDNFPKADPTEVPATPDGPSAINLVTWRPYTNDLDTTGYLTLRGDGQVLGGWDSFASPARYARTPRSLPGVQGVIGLTDTAAAEKYQIVTASLMNPAGQYVAPTSDALTAAAAAMTATPSQEQVYGFDFASDAAKGAPGAYPLAMPVYAAANPALKNAELRATYASFIRFVASTGQNPGVELGQLPAGYAPLPTGWRGQAAMAADLIQTGGAFVPTTPTGGSPAAPNAPVRTAANSSSLPAAAPPAATNPQASGDVAGALSGGTTPDDPEIVGVQAAVPVSLLAGLASAALVPIIPRFRRRL
ncbi:hypothetical protein MN032_01415 [Agromyces atrinae]|uniref:hypothetical protein n=1 Tax=Agromyces atrinae TaxID=592376 RepID=UPI001F55E274|nr:hypothetical protein [Agromyces atrinae]MCI2956335.1 hypothetical protein [Agromyces atrinae]